MPGEEAEPDDVSERVARGFEALVSEEAAVHGGPASSPSSSAPAAPQTPAEAPMSIAATRLVALEGRVRQTMDRLTELVEAQLPETVDGLRADLETLRLELQTSLAQAAEVMVEERKQLRSQIATTVGAANRWFVRARDQINERLDRIAEAASQAQEQAEVAAVAATAAASVFTEADAEAPAPVPVLVPARPAAAAPEGIEVEFDVGAEVGAAPVADLGEDEGGIEWEIEGEDREYEEGTVTRLESAELEALLDPVRGDVQELQLEVSSMGEAVTELASQLAKLATRIPVRPKGVKLAPDQIELIVEAVLAALLSSAPLSSAPLSSAPASTPARQPAPAAKTAPAKKKVEPPLKQAAAVLAKKKAAAGGRGAILR